MKRILPLLIISIALLASCRAPDADTRAVVSRVEVGSYLINERTIAPADIKEPSYYEAEISDGINAYRSVSADGAFVFTDVFVGTYSVTVSGFDRKGGQKIWKSSGQDILTVSVNGSNSISVAMALINSEGTGSIKVRLDWSEAIKTAGLMKDAYDESAFSFELVQISDDGTKTPYSSQSAEKGVTEYIYEDSSIPVSAGFTGYFNIYYTKDNTDFLLMQTATAVFQVYAGQTSVPDDSDTELFIITSNNSPNYPNPPALSLSYGSENPETSITASWSSNADRYFQTIYIECSNGEIAVVDASESSSYTFENLEKATSYTFVLYAKTKLGKETEKIEKSFATKVFVTSIDFDESILPESFITNGDNFELEASINPENATLCKVLWSTSDSSVLEAVSASDKKAVFYAKKPGVVTITAIAADKGINGETISYESTNAVSVHLCRPKAPDVIIIDGVISKEISLAWAEVPYAEGYKIYRNGEYLATVEDTEYSDAALIAGKSYSYSIEAINNSLKTEDFDPTSEMSSSSEECTPVKPTITLIQPVLNNLRLELRAGEAIAKGAITVTPDAPAVISIPAAIDGAVEYSWFVNGILKKTSADFDEMNAITLTYDMPEVQDYDKDANSIMLRVKDSKGNYHSASAYFRVILVKDTGVEISMDDHYSTALGTLKFNASVLPGDATMRELTYSSSNDDIASIDSEGVITIKKHGTVTFTAASSSGASNKKEIRFYNPITDAKALLNLMNADFYTVLHNADNQFKGDWWPGISAEKYSESGYSISSSHSVGVNQYTGSMSISNHVVSSAEYGDFVVSTTTSIVLYAKNGGGAGYLGTDPLQYIGYSNGKASSAGTIVITLPYSQGNATIGYNNIKIADGKSGSFEVTMPNQNAVTISYDDSVEAIF